MTLYTPEVREYVHTRNWPKGLQLDVVEDVMDIEGEEVRQLRFIFYRDNWLQFEAQQHLIIANTVKEVMETLRANGIQCYMGRMESRANG